MSVRPDGEPSSGTAPNISLGGVYAVLDRPVPIIENQQIQLGLVTQIGMLEIRGRIHRIRTATGRVVAPPEFLGAGFAVEKLGRSDHAACSRANAVYPSAD